MTYQIEFSDRERELMLGLLEAERKDMHSAVRRSMTNLTAHEEFQQELKMVQGIIAKMQNAAMPTA